MERDGFFSERGAKSPTKEEILRSSERPGGDEVGWRERVHNPNFERDKIDDSEGYRRSKSNALNRLSEI